MSAVPFEAIQAVPAEPVRATRPALLAAAGASVVAAALVPAGRPGVNLLIVALAAGGAVYAARSREISLTARAYAGLGLALAATATLRAADWVVAVNVLAALVLAGLAAADATTWRDVLLAPFGYLRRLLAVPAFLGGGLRRESEAPRRALAPALRAGALVVGLLAVFGTLFASADRAFADLVERILVPDWALGELAMRVLVFIFAMVAIGGLGLARHRSHAESFVPPSPWLGETGLRPAIGRVEWTAGLVALDLLFAAFVAVQLAVLFGGHDHVLRTAGLTYAEYARQGFFQLVVVGGLTLAVIAATVRLGVVEGPQARRLLRMLAGTLCVLTLVVLASAMHRLGLYEEAFGFTQERLVVHAVIWWLAALFVLVLIAGAVWKGGWLPRATVALTAAGLLAFTLANPDALVASRNVERYSRTGSLDVGYLGAAMSADAVPALLRLPPPYRACVLAPVAARLGHDGWAEFNLGRARARALLRGMLKVPTQPCPTELP
jgi:uncharacterized protein DUF4153